MERWDDLSPEQQSQLVEEAMMWAGRQLLTRLGHEVPNNGLKRVDSLQKPQDRYIEPTFEHDPFIDGIHFNDKGYPEDAP